MKEQDRVRGELQLWRQWRDSCRYEGEQRMIEGEFDQEAGPYDKNEGEQSLNEGDFDQEARPYEKMEGEQSLNEGESFEKETENFVMESKIELEGEAAKVNENSPKKCKVKLQCEKFDQKSAITADELIVKNFGKESQLELKFEISRNESVTGTADVDAKKTVGRMPVIEQKSGKVDNKRMVLEWKPKKERQRHGGFGGRQKRRTMNSSERGGVSAATWPTGVLNRPAVTLALHTQLGDPALQMGHRVSIMRLSLTTGQPTIGRTFELR